MRVLLVSNQACNPHVVGNPILHRMKMSLCNDNRVENVDFVRFRSKSPIKTLMEIRREAKQHDIVHVHFGGIYSLLVRFFLIGRKCHKLITFHGTDIHAKAIKTTKSRLRRTKIRINQKASFACIRWYEAVGFVSDEMKNYVPSRLMRKFMSRMFTQPLGVDYQVFTPISQEQARKELGIDGGYQVLFSDVHNSCVKRRDIAKKIVSELGENYHLLVMCGVKPDQVPVWINACDFVLLTSDEEGSPNIIRESIALNKRVYSVDVGDARRQIKGLHNSAIISRVPEEAADQIRHSLNDTYTDNSRETHREIIDFDIINKHIVDMYERMMET